MRWGRRTPARRAVTIAGVAARGVLGLVLLALPAVALGWQASLLWQPDLSTLIVLMGALLLVTATLRLGTLLRRVPGTRQEVRLPGTAQTKAAPSSTPVIR